eukprot:9036848-Heterocapsa_arctica.AAC.1
MAINSLSAVESVTVGCVRDQDAAAACRPSARARRPVGVGIDVDAVALLPHADRMPGQLQHPVDGAAQ